MAATVTPVAAQSARTLPAAGTWGLFFDLPDGGGSGVGLRRMLSEDRSLGLVLQFNAASLTREHGTPPVTDEHSRFFAGVGADLRFYRRARGPVVPFVQTGTFVGYENGSGDDWSLAGDLALGAEWLPLDQVSVSAFAGMRAAWRRATDSTVRDTATSLGLVRSGLALTLYF